MTSPAQQTGFWRSIRELPGRTPLRVKLIAALLALVAIGLVVISVLGIAILRNDLISPYDTSLQEQFQGPAVSRLIQNYLNNGATGTAAEASLDWIPAGGAVHQVIQPTSGLVGRLGMPAAPLPSPVISADPSSIEAHLGHPFTVPAQSGSGRWRVLMEQLPLSDGSTGTVVLATDVTSAYTTVGQLAATDLIVSAVLLLGLAILGVTVVRRSLRPLHEIEQTAGAIAAGDLTRRVPERDPGTEVGRLGRSLNAMLSQIETAFRSQARSEEAARRSEEKMRQFVGDASHELRTPLTAIRGFAEYYRQRGGMATGEPGSGQLQPTDLDRIMRRVEQESARMGVLVEDMLLLARLDQQRPLEVQSVDLLTLAADAVHDARVVAPSREIHLTIGSKGALLVTGDEVRLRQVIGNLMTNALTHTPDGTPVDVLIRTGTLAEAPMTATPQPAPPPPPPAPGADDAQAEDHERPHDGGWQADEAGLAKGQNGYGPAQGGNSWPHSPRPAAILQVADHGPGLTSEQAEHVFERFYRADLSRTSGGTGLGLAIVAALVAAHGGVAWVESEPGHGATFSIALPLSPEAVHSDDDEDADVEPEGGYDEDGPAYPDTEAYQALDYDEWVRLHSTGS